MLPSLCVAFLAGLGCGSFLPFFPLAISAVLLLIVLVLCAIERAGTIDVHHSVTWCAALFLGVLYWIGTMPPAAHPLQDQLVQLPIVERPARVVGLVQHAPYRMTLILRLEQLATDMTVPQTVRLTWRDPGGAVFAGDRIVFRAKLRRPTGALNPRGFDYAAYVEGQGVSTVATVSGPEAVRVVGPKSGTSWWWQGWGQIDRWRGAIREAAIQSLSQPGLGFFLGIIIGERGYVQADLQDWFMTTGTVHLLSISGSHLGLIAVVVFGAIRRGLIHMPASTLLSLSRRITPTRLAILSTWVVVTFYALLAGAELATMRAWVMICLAFATIWIGSERHLLHALAAAALLIVLHDPRAVGDISFQLSFLSVLAIVWAVASLSRQPDSEAQCARPWKIWGRLVCEAILLGAAVTFMTIPLVAWYFNQVPWLGLVTNLVAVPVTGFVLVPVGLLSALASLIGGPEGLPFAGAQQHMMAWMVSVLHWCATVPGGDWRVAAPPPWAMVLYYGGVAVAVGVVSFHHHRTVGIGLVMLALVGWIGSAAPIVDGDRWRVTFLDVGQGDSALIELPGGQTVLIDGGTRYERFDIGRGVIAPFLWNHGIRRLDHIVATHPQRDHVGGLPWVIRHLAVGQYWHTDVERHEPLFEELQQAIRDRNIADHVARRGQEIVSGNVCRLTILNPIPAMPAAALVQHMSGTVLNNRSVVTQLLCGVHSVVFAADIESEGLHRLAVSREAPMTVLKVPHHGARSSLDSEWIARLHPRYAVISVGQHNSYGHPAQEVLDRYIATGSEIVRTDVVGAITVTGHLSTSHLAVRTMRDLMVEPVSVHLCLWMCERENWRRVWRQLRDV